MTTLLQTQDHSCKSIAPPPPHSGIIAWPPEIITGSVLKHPLAIMNIIKCVNYLDVKRSGAMAKRSIVQIEREGGGGGWSDQSDRSGHAVVGEPLSEKHTDKKRFAAVSLISATVEKESGSINQVRCAS